MALYSIDLLNSSFDKAWIRLKFSLYCGSNIALQNMAIRQPSTALVPFSFVFLLCHFHFNFFMRKRNTCDKGCYQEEVVQFGPPPP